MTKYKLRAESIQDIVLFLYSDIPILSYSIVSEDGLDPEMTFTTPKSLKVIRTTLNNLTDCHVMAQTVQKEHLYTGERI